MDDDLDCLARLHYQMMGSFIDLSESSFPRSTWVCRLIDVSSVVLPAVISSTAYLFVYNLYTNTLSTIEAYIGEWKLFGSLGYTSPEFIPSHSDTETNQQSYKISLIVFSLVGRPSHCTYIRIFVSVVMSSISRSTVDCNNAFQP